MLVHKAIFHYNDFLQTVYQADLPYTMQMLQ